MRSNLLFATTLALSTFGVPALVLAAPHDSATQRQVDDDDDGPKPKFPMTAADFRQMIDARTAKARQHMETCASTLPADQAQVMRTNFDAGVVKINDEVQKATADGTVTKDEAKKVRDTAKSVHHDDPKTCKH